MRYITDTELICLDSISFIFLQLSFIDFNIPWNIRNFVNNQVGLKRQLFHIYFLTADANQMCTKIFMHLNVHSTLESLALEWLGKSRQSIIIGNLKENNIKIRDKVCVNLFQN